MSISQLYINIRSPAQDIYSQMNVNIQPAIKDIYQDTVNYFNQEATVWFGKTVKALGEKIKNTNPLVAVIAVLAIAIIFLVAAVAVLSIKVKILNYSAETAKQVAQTLATKNEELEDKNKGLEATIETNNNEFLTEKLNLQAEIATKNIQNQTLVNDNTQLKNSNAELSKKLDCSNEKTQDLKNMIKLIFNIHCMARAGNRLKNENAKLTAEVANLNKKFDDFKSTKTKLDETIVQLRNDNIQLTTEMKNLEKQLKTQDEPNKVEKTDQNAAIETPPNETNSENSSWGFAYLVEELGLG